MQREHIESAGLGAAVYAWSESFSEHYGADVFVVAKAMP